MFKSNENNDKFDALVGGICMQDRTIAQFIIIGGGRGCSANNRHQTNL